MYKNTIPYINYPLAQIKNANKIHLKINALCIVEFFESLFAYKQGHQFFRNINPSSTKFLHLMRVLVARQDREVIDFTRSHVKNIFELTNLMKIPRIEGYNGKYGSNPQGNKEVIDVFFKIDQIGQ